MSEEDYLELLEEALNQFTVPQEFWEWMCWIGNKDKIKRYINHKNLYNSLKEELND